MKNICEALESRRLLAGYVQDTSFGDHGTVAISGAPDMRYAGIDVEPPQTMIDSKGRVVVVIFPHSGDSSLTIHRYNADGSIDKTFNSTGVLKLPIVDSGVTPMVTLLQDDSLVVALREPGEPLLERYTESGKLDPTFASNADNNYKPFMPGGLDNEESLSTDSAGRVVWMQYFESPVGIKNSEWQLAVRVARYLPSGKVDNSFGSRGAIIIKQQPIDVPNSYKIQGKILNLRADVENSHHQDIEIQLTAPQINADDNIIIAGSAYYARGSLKGDIPYSNLVLPFIYSFNSRTGAVNRKLVIGVNQSKATFTDGALQYKGMELGEPSTTVAPDGAVYICSDYPHFSIAVFKPDGSTFDISGFNDDFLTEGLQVFGDSVWALRGGTGLADSNFLTQVFEDATAGESVGIARTATDSPITFQGVKGNLPERIIGFNVGEGFEGSPETSIRSVNLTEQEGSATIVNGVLEINGTAGEDVIDISRRGNGRFLVTGAGPTRSFAPESFSKIRVLGGGGDDVIQDDYFASLDKKRLIIYGQGGSDTIYGSPGNDQLDGGSGDDSIDSGTGVDTLYGQSGDDALYFNSDNSGAGDLIFGGSGTDTSFKADKDPQPTYNSVENT